MESQFSRSELLVGADAIKKLHNARVAVFGVGGVGGFVVEALARSGVGALDLIDHDTVALSNINRQIIATHSTIGRLKAEVARERVLDINPDCKVKVFDTFFLPETAHLFDFSDYDYVVDAIDTVAGKIALVEACQETGTPIICSMGAGNKLDPTAFRVADIYRTNVCPLAKTMRRELKKRGIKKLKVVYSEEQPLTPKMPEEERVSGADTLSQNASGGEEVRSAGISEKRKPSRRQTPGSMSFVPSVVGLIIGGEVIKDLIREEKGERRS